MLSDEAVHAAAHVCPSNQISEDVNLKSVYLQHMYTHCILI